MPYKDISKIVRISDVAVHKRVRKLDKVIRAFTVTIDQAEYGKTATALINLKCEVGRTAEIAKALSKFEDVTEVYTTVGEYDIVAKIRTDDTLSLKNIVEKQLTKIRGINEVRTSIVFDCFKEKVSLVL